jgi:hypothetical protein
MEQLKTKISNRIIYILYTLFILGFLVLSYSLINNNSYKQNQIILLQKQKQLEEYQTALKSLSSDKDLNLSSIGLKISPKDQKECTDEHPIKVKFDNANPRYYTKKSKMYKRVNPDACANSTLLLELVKDFSEG